MQKTPLYLKHLESNAKIVSFAGWQMPINYGSQIEEHQFVRQHAGIFDVSHMTIVDLTGNDVTAYLRRLLANDVNKINQSPGKALYSCMLNEKGGVIDDLIVYYMNDSWYRLIVNSSTQEKDLHWLKKQIQHDKVEITQQKSLAMLAVQGPEAIKICQNKLNIKQNIKPFSAFEHEDMFIARTGYTGEDGYEIICNAEKIASLWQQLLDAGVKPCGLGARDTLRLEAGMNLYGNDMDENYTPLESGLTWTVSFQGSHRNFIGKQALLEQQQSGLKSQFVGLVLDGKGILRSHQVVHCPDVQENGIITSGGFSPSLQKSIAFARIPVSPAKQFDNCMVEIRHKLIPATIVPLPFVRHGKSLIS